MATKNDYRTALAVALASCELSEGVVRSILRDKDRVRPKLERADEMAEFVSRECKSWQ